MTFKIVNGLVGSLPQMPQQGTGATAHDARQPAGGTEVSMQAAHSDAVVTTVFTSVRKTASRDNIVSFDKARDVARGVASRIKADRDETAHRGLEVYGGRDAARHIS